MSTNATTPSTGCAHGRAGGAAWGKPSPPTTRWPNSSGKYDPADSGTARTSATSSPRLAMAATHRSSAARIGSRPPNPAAEDGPRPLVGRQDRLDRLELGVEDRHLPVGDGVDLVVPDDGAPGHRHGKVAAGAGRAGGPQPPQPPPDPRARRPG